MPSRSHWPGIAIQRCAAHKLWNLQSKAPARLREELTEDYRRMFCGATAAAAQQERARYSWPSAPQNFYSVPRILRSSTIV